MKLLVDSTSSGSTSSGGTTLQELSFAGKELPNFLSSYVDDLYVKKLIVEGEGFNCNLAF